MGRGLVTTETGSDLIHRFDLTVLMMAVKKIDIGTRLHNTQTHGAREAEQADIGAVCLCCASDGFLIGANIIGFLIL